MASAYPQVLETSAVTIDSVTWTAISAPIACNELYILVEGSSSVKIRTDSADANTEKTIGAGSEWSPAGGGSVASSGQAPRFPAGQNIAFAQAVTGTGPLKVTALL